ncbi:MAG: phytanoyl-CoA dioxygenase family protein [Paenibacillaceae bacterium]|nr:phytanoyl-CoA dioxygenase family protein [Paenibacillaceae bacterium]
MMDNRKQYEEQGYVIYRHVLDDALMREAQEHVLHLMKLRPDLPPEKFEHVLFPDDPFFVRLTGDERLLDIVESYIGPDIALFGAHYFCKMPYTGQAVLWHQDGSYWPLDPMEVVTLWLAVDESTRENGCLRVIPRSHKLALQTMGASTGVPNVLDSEIDPSFVNEAEAVDIELNPGDVEVHHPNIIHGSEANRSPKRRCGLAIRYISTRTRILWDKWPTFVLRGEAVPGVNAYLDRPSYVEGKHMSFRGAERWAQRKEFRP